MRWLKFGLIMSFLIMFAKVLELSIIKGGYYTRLADNNQTFESNIPSPRGTIFDRKGRILAQSLYHYFRKNDQVVVWEGTETYSGERFESEGLSFEIRRKYPYANSASFVTGYVAKPLEKEVDNASCEKYLNDRSLSGRGGVEAWYDCQLRGVDGRRVVEVDARGKFIRDLGRVEPIAGEDIHLSIDAFWQERAYKLLAGRKGVVIISEPKNGNILALVSSPAFNPNDFSYQIDNLKIKQYLQDKADLPLLNRAISARYHPGSVYKMVVAAAGLEERAINQNTTFVDTGVIKVGEYEYKNWLWTKRNQTDGQVDVLKGLQRSNDIYFYRLGGLLGPEIMKKWSEKFGYGGKTGISLVGEVDGNIPDEKWKIKAKGEKWFLGNSYHMAIGQGDVDVTPLQVHMATAAIANDGVYCKPRLNTREEENCWKMGLDYTNVKILQEGMKRACATGGTAWPLFNFKTKIACKTGTAQVGDGSPDTHAWLTAFAPIVDPQVVVTVMVERGGEGSDEAAPIVGDLLKDWFEEVDTVVPRKINGKVIQ